MKQTDEKQKVQHCKFKLCGSWTTKTNIQKTYKTKTHSLFFFQIGFLEEGKKSESTNETSGRQNSLEPVHHAHGQRVRIYPTLFAGTNTDQFQVNGSET